MEGSGQEHQVGMVKNWVNWRSFQSSCAEQMKGSNLNGRHKMHSLFEETCQDAGGWDEALFLSELLEKDHVPRSRTNAEALVGVPRWGSVGECMFKCWGYVCRISMLFNLSAGVLDMHQASSNPQNPG